MLVFNKDEIRENLTLDNIFELLQMWGGDPEYSVFGILSSTICHNRPGEGSRKLYYYENTKLFRCYTGCDASFDIFELVIKIEKIQNNQEWDFIEAVRYIAYKFGFAGQDEKADGTNDLADWKRFAAYDRIDSIELKTQNIILKEYDTSVLSKLSYNILLYPWLKEGIGQDVLNKAKIGYFLGTDQITIPHFDINNRFIGLRGRTMVQEDAERFGKYRPMIINKQQFNHPLGYNLYNLNNSKTNIKNVKTAIVFEGEKSTLLYQTYFGIENDISVACCGSSLSAYQINLLLELGVNEIVIAFDRQFQDIGDSEFKHLTRNLTKIFNKYKNYTNISFIFDKNMITGYKNSPIDCGKDTFLKLFKERISL